MPKGVKNGPQHLRLISRNEAAEMMGCSATTISNWVEKGIIKGHKLDNLLLVDKESIEKLLDSAADVADMERNLRELKSKLADEIQKRNQKIKSLYDETALSNQDRFLKELIDCIIESVKDQLSDKEFIIVSGVLKGRPTSEIAKEIGRTDNTVWNTWRRVMPKLFDILEYPTVCKEKEDLADENKKLKEEIKQLKSAQRGRNLQATPFAKDLTDFGFPTHLCNKLLEFGCKSLADLLQYDTYHLLNIPKIGASSICQIKERLNLMGLSLGMDLQHMSDEDFNALVKRVNDFLPSVFIETIPTRYLGNERSLAKIIEHKDKKIEKLQQELELKKKSSDTWRTKYRELHDSYNISLRTQKAQKLEEKKQQVIVKASQLTQTKKQLKKALAKLNKASEKEAELKRRISSLENLVEYYKKKK